MPTCLPPLARNNLFFTSELRGFAHVKSLWETGGFFVIAVGLKLLATGNPDVGTGALACVGERSL